MGSCNEETCPGVRQGEIAARAGVLSFLPCASRGRAHDVLRRARRASKVVRLWDPADYQRGTKRWLGQIYRTVPQGREACADGLFRRGIRWTKMGSTLGQAGL